MTMLLPDGGNLRAVVFDFDGTLARPVLDFKVMRKAVSDAITAHMTPVTPRPDLPVMEWLQTMYDALAHDSPEMATSLFTAGHAAIRAVEVEAARRTDLFPFVRPLLASLTEQGVRTGIITRNCPEAVRTVFPDVDDLCGCLLTRDDVRDVKPHPDHLLQALKLLEASPEESLMVGDHSMDVETGKRAGTLTAGVASGETSREGLHEAGATFVADDCAALFDSLGYYRR